MDFGWTDDQLALRQLVLDFARHELDRGASERDAAAQFPRDAWAACARIGLQALPLPAEYGGTGASALTTIVAMEALGEGCSDNGLIFSLNAHLWAVQHPLLRFGTPAQHERWLPGLGDGSLVAAHAMSEPESGSDAFALRTTATPTDGGYVLHGSKTFVTNGPVADLFLVFATTDRSRGFAGVCAFIVERGAPGLTVGPPFRKLGLHTSPMSEVVFDGCLVPSENILGRPGGGLPVFLAGMERERSLILASAIGSMQRGLDRSVDHARERRQFGSPIGAFQAVSHRLVEMRLRLESARVLLYRLGWMIDQGRAKQVSEHSALVKLAISEAYVQNSLDALQVLGGYGYVEGAAERDLRDAVASRIYSGTSDIQRNIVARSMGVG